VALVLATRAPSSARRALGFSLVLALTITALAASASGATGKLSPPVIREKFTVLPCNHETTVGLEGCAEGQLLATDHRINVEVALLFRVLDGATQRRSFVTSEDLWFKYRDADCQSVASIYGGGTLAPVEFADCEVLDNESRSVDLLGHYELVEQGSSSPPAWP